MSEINGCVGHTTDMLPFERRTPGNPSNNTYGIDFDIDYKIVEQGATYKYNCEGDNRVHGLGGGRAGYGRFGELIMDFTFKDGRKFHEVLDFRQLMAAMLEKYEIHQIPKGNKEMSYRGSAELSIKINNNKLTVDYELVDTINGWRGPHKYYHYPIFEKDFQNPFSIDTERKEKHDVLQDMPGNPDLNLCGISFMVDKNAFARGTYSYAPEGSRVLIIADEGRFGYQSTGVLSLDYTLKNGRRIQEQIDLQPLLNELLENPQLINLSATMFGGYADLVVRIASNRLEVDYRLLERKKKQSSTEMKWEETYNKERDRPSVNYRLIQDLTSDPSQYKEHLYPVFIRKFQD